MRLVIACLVGIIVMLEARSAEAICALPRAGFSPPTGTVLPAKATVYLFAYSFETDPHKEVDLDPMQAIERKLKVDGASVVARWVATTPVYSVVRIDLTAKRQEVSIQWDSGRANASYRIGAPAPNDATVIGVTHHTDQWTCSHQNTIDIELTGDAIAYRLDWSDKTSTLLPPTIDILFDSHPSPSSHEISLGHVSCLGYTVNPEALVTLRAFHLVALFSDSSERRIGASKAKLAHDGVQLPHELLKPIAGNPKATQGLRESQGDVP